MKKPCLARGFFIGLRVSEVRTGGSAKRNRAQKLASSTIERRSAERSEESAIRQLIRSVQAEKDKVRYPASGTTVILLKYERLGQVQQDRFFSLA